MTTEKAEMCGQLANIRYTWPGKDEALVCAECATGIAKVANAIGLPLQLIPVTSRDVAVGVDWPTCSQPKPAE